MTGAIKVTVMTRIVFYFVIHSNVITMSVNHLLTQNCVSYYYSFIITQEYIFIMKIDLCKCVVQSLVNNIKCTKL